MSLPSSVPSERFGCPQCLSVFRAGFARCPLDGAALQALSGDPLIGHLLADRYVIEELLGEGGMGRVYRARHMRMSRRFAVKVLFGDMAADAKARTRFSREAEAVSRLNHPNVLSVVDFGETDEGLLYLVMDFIEGRELHQLLAQEAPLSPQRVLALLRQLTRGLAHAHERNLIHRDFKTENVVVTRSGDEELARIVDFGIAAVGEMMEPAQRLTTEGMVLGTPAYMSPEQSTGEEVDERSDLFSLGVMLYEMLCGRLPFDGTAVAIAKAHLASEVPAIAERVPGLRVDQRLEAVAMRLMAKDPDDRFQSARALIAHLDSAFGRADSQSEGADSGATVQVGSDQMPRAISAEQLAMISYQMAEMARSQQTRRLYDPRWIATGAAVLVTLIAVVIALAVRGGDDAPERKIAAPEAAGAVVPAGETGATDPAASPGPASSTSDPGAMPATTAPISGTAGADTAGVTDPTLVDPGAAGVPPGGATPPSTPAAGLAADAAAATEPASAAEPQPIPISPATTDEPDGNIEEPEPPPRAAQRDRPRPRKSRSRSGRRSASAEARSERPESRQRPEEKPDPPEPPRTETRAPEPAPVPPAEKVESPKDFMARYREVGKQLDRLAGKHGEDAVTPLRKRYEAIAPLDAMRNEAIRRDAEAALKSIGAKVARELARQ